MSKTKEFSASHDIGDIVYHKLTNDPGIIVGYLIEPRSVMYKVVWGIAGETLSYAIELQKEKPIE